MQSIRWKICGQLAVAATLAAALFLLPPMGFGARAQDYEQAIKSAAESVSKILSRDHRGAKVAIVDFRDGRVNVECEPLSGMLTNEMRRAVINFRNDWILDFQVVEEADPGIPGIVILVGSWLVTADEQIALTIELGTLGGGNARHLQMDKPTFEKSSLSSEAAACVLEFETVDRRLTLVREALVRRAPSFTAPVVKELAPGTQVWVIARVKGGDWLVARLSDVNDTLALRMSDQRGFIFGDPFSSSDANEMTTAATDTSTLDTSAKSTVTEKVGGVVIDWETNTIRARGFGAANRSFPETVWKRSAEEAAKIDAQAKLLEFVNGALLQSRTFVQNYQVALDEKLKEIRGHLPYARQVGPTVFPTEDTAEVVLELDIE